MYVVEGLPAQGINVMGQYKNPPRHRPWRHDDAAVAVVEDDVGAVGLGESWRGLDEFLGIHRFSGGLDDR